MGYFCSEVGHSGYFRGGGDVQSIVLLTKVKFILFPSEDIVAMVRFFFKGMKGPVPVVFIRDKSKGTSLYMVCDGASQVV
jgi:hypothetical protein